MQTSFVNPVLQVIALIVNKVKSVTAFVEDKSLADVTKLTRVEPLTIISNDLASYEILPEINQSLVNIFAAYYLQAAAIMTNVNEAEVIRTLDKLNPDRDETGFLLSVGTEGINTMMEANYKYALPTKEKKVSLESNDGVINLSEAVNLSVGKLINVEINYQVAGKNKTTKIPVNVRLMVSLVSARTIMFLLTKGKGLYDDMGERYHLWRSKRIGFIKDLIFCQDMIDEQRKAIITDDTGTIGEIIRRVNNSKKFGLLSSNPSLATASNIFVISKSIAMDIERTLGGKLANPSIREKAFENTYAMIIVVVDQETERVVFYIRNTAASTDLSYKEIKSVNKGKGPDVMDMLRQMQMGSSIGF